MKLTLLFLSLKKITIKYATNIYIFFHLEIKIISISFSEREYYLFNISLIMLIKKLNLSRKKPCETQQIWKKKTKTKVSPAFPENPDIVSVYLVDSSPTLKLMYLT